MRQIAYSQLKDLSREYKRYVSKTNKTKEYYTYVHIRRNVVHSLKYISKLHCMLFLANASDSSTVNYFKPMHKIAQL
jgi:hypothetical protein